jgi:hypothetical protein
VTKQALPQLPQLFTFVDSVVSQPLPALPSQFPNPEVQDATWHAPPTQVEVPLGAEQAKPHEPQLFGSVDRVASQPLLIWPSQFPNPTVQAIEQVPPLHPGVPFPPGQTLPQVPQSLTLVATPVSQPSASLPSQSANPAVHETEQTPPAQDGVPFDVEHTFPQVPQLPLSDARVVSQPLATLPSQLPKPVLHVAT